MGKRPVWTILATLTMLMALSADDPVKRPTVKSSKVEVSQGEPGKTGFWYKGHRGPGAIVVAHGTWQRGTGLLETFDVIGMTEDGCDHPRQQVPHDNLASLRFQFDQSLDLIAEGNATGRGKFEGKTTMKVVENCDDVLTTRFEKTQRATVTWTAEGMETDAKGDGRVRVKGRLIIIEFTITPHERFECVFKTKVVYTTTASLNVKWAVDTASVTGGFDVKSEVREHDLTCKERK